MTKFGENLKVLIKSRGMNSVSFAKKMGVSTAYISQLVTGVRKPGYKTMMNIARLLDIPFDIVAAFDGRFKMSLPRKVPVLDETNIDKLLDYIDSNNIVLISENYEYALSEDKQAFFVKPKAVRVCCALEKCDLILIEPNAEIKNGDNVLVCLNGSFSVKKIGIKKDIIILFDDEQEPISFLKEDKHETRMFRVKQCITNF